MKKITLPLLACLALPLVAAAPAQAAKQVSLCDTAIKDAKPRSGEPARGRGAVPGLRVSYLPKGFIYGDFSHHSGKKAWEYGYAWSDDRDDVDRKHRSLWVRVVCWPAAKSLKDLPGLPVVEGSFATAEKATVGGRKVLTKEGDGALGHGRYVGWVERPGVVITVMASEPLTSRLGRIIKGIRATN
ncbi:hypothetical protein [Nonomuraea soli]|uniref:Uncharacterized protein n=1 Tax=Nonomuraea soli TaxID=1032476 RepID=A0A7W0CUF7_9ACTN|nr:hypothetical protein [Nonomuraea soli]MBA2897572.1 hypothetical protein [Nonomuraea soli]